MVEFLEKVLAFSLKVDFVLSHKSLAEEWLFFVLLIKITNFEIVILS